MSSQAVSTVIAPGERRAWAEQKFRGMEAFVMPSFTPDLAALDEDGIRNDVRHGIRQGFCALYGAALSLTPDEHGRFLEILVDEAQGQVAIGGNISGGGTLAEQIAGLKYAESIGVSEAILSFDTQAATEDEIYDSTRQLIEATGMGIVLYAAPRPAFRRFSPVGLPMNAINRLADQPNVIAIKLTQTIDFVAAYQIAELVGDRLIVGAVNLEILPLLANKYNVQWSGEWAVDSIQSPEKPYAVQFIDLVAQGRTAEATDAYWAMKPALQAFFELQGPSLRAGGHPWSHMKYYKWLTGGNGGLIRDQHKTEEQVPTLDAAARQACRDTFESVGITCVDLPDEAFVVGNAAYAQGARMKDMAALPHYAR
jgi:4-hydroxy-tetrahydrodipicolinate synthase